MAQLAQKIELFINQAGIKGDADLVTPELEAFFTSAHKYPRRVGIHDDGVGGTAPHVLLKRSILYYLRGGDIVNSQPCHQDQTGTTVYTFDGSTVERVEPAFYLAGARQKGKGRSGVGFGYVGLGMSNNNNNNGNNNNNNG